MNRPAILPCRPVWRPANCPPPHQQGCRRHGRRQGWVDAATRHGVEQERGCGPALVDEGADISAADKRGSTPLRSSALRGARRWPDCSSTEALSSRPPTSAGQRSYAPRQRTELGGSPATYRRECRRLGRHVRTDAVARRGVERARGSGPAHWRDADPLVADEHGSVPLLRHCKTGTGWWPGCPSTKALASWPPTRTGQHSHTPRQGAGTRRRPDCSSAGAQTPQPPMRTG